jgi:DNA polymerase III delta prime subunit
MALRGKKPEHIEKRLKALFYGMAGVGKTTAAIQFPKPYLIDTEKGAENEQYVQLLQSNGGVIFQTSDFDEMTNEIRALLSEKHEYKTLIIDPLTVVYNHLVETSTNFLKRISKDKNATGTEFGRHYAEADKKMKHLLNLLLRLDMNVIITAHAKAVYDDNMKVIDRTFDCYKKLDYLFDVAFEIQKRGRDRVGIIKKTRIASFPDGDQFPFSYDEIANRYGRDILEKEANPETLASKEQVAELNRLIEIMRVDESIWEKWLDKSKCETFNEMPSEIIQKCIDALNKKLTTTEKTDE